ncbi:MAG: tubulin/FtsZ family protein [Dehalococcoidales bacterium]
MKLIVIGLGQCGGRIADEFARMGKRAVEMRNIDVIVDAFAVNTNTADMATVRTIKADHQHRILIGVGKTRGHGVAKLNELGAEIARADADKIMDALRTTKDLYEADAFLLVSSTAGGTGSGAIPIIANVLKERFVDKPVYTILVLPFEHEETAEEMAVYNTAVCLKSTYSIADAVILVDNQRYIKKDFSLKNNIYEINRLIVEPFFDLLCAGEEKKYKHIGAKVMDAGDIIQTLCGWTAIGYGEVKLPLITLPRDWSADFNKRGERSHKGLQAMDEAVKELSIDCNPQESGRALFLISAPTKEMDMNLIKELGDHLRRIASQAIIRSGDYPREKGLLDVTVILSELSDVAKVRSYYVKASELAQSVKKREGERVVKESLVEDAGKDVPTLL